MLLSWLPWKYIVRQVARARGFIDPIRVLAQLHRFAQPAEVSEPIELLRAGVVFHARGLMNGVIQHNLDWVWPYWVERQFDPGDVSFIPRAFSVTHINLTHRNWTALGQPDCDQLPIVDPRGLITPFWDSWSLDAWVIAQNDPVSPGVELFPSRAPDARQRLVLEPGPGVSVLTSIQGPGLSLDRRASVVDDGEGIGLVEELTARSDGPGWLVVALRPCNPEGVSFLHDVELAADRLSWIVGTEGTVQFSEPAERHRVSSYRDGDVHMHLLDARERTRVHCDVGLVTAAAMYRLQPGETRRLNVRVPLEPSPQAATNPSRDSGARWAQALEGTCRLEVPDPSVQATYDAAVRTLILHTPGDAYPGPFTYKRFWFRDATFMAYALMCAGLTSRARRVLDRFGPRQTRAGYFQSQEGEWDSNGQALWIMRKYSELTGLPVPPEWKGSITRAAQWIVDKRLPELPQSPTAGLLPAGFSAEHLGPSDYYYWDDFWGIAGLTAAGSMLEQFGEGEQAQRFLRLAQSFQGAVDRSLASTATRPGVHGMPASPHRRSDAGAVGSLVAGYPLQLVAADDPRLSGTADFLLGHCMHDGGFFQDMVHSGINPYLTLHLAQVLMRRGDPGSEALMRTVLRLASPTGQWPEAIHPRTGGGCMGDGQHAWAAGEWILALRNAFLREEDDRLVVGSGLWSDWMAPGARARLGPAPTSFGDVDVSIEGGRDGVRVSWTGQWRRSVPIEVRLPGFPVRVCTQGEGETTLERRCAQ